MVIYALLLHQVIKDDCQADLNEAMPAYKASIKALDSLDKKSIQEMKSFNTPPEMVAVCIEAVCILLGQSSLALSSFRNRYNTGPDYPTTSLLIRRCQTLMGRRQEAPVHDELHGTSQGL